MEQTEEQEIEKLEVIDAEPVSTTRVDGAIVPFEEEKLHSEDVQRAIRLYILLPFAFLLVTLFGGLRFNGTDGSVMYLSPALIYLIFGATLMALFFVAGLIRLDGWVSERFPITKNVINGITLLAMYAACVQMFNSVIPESGVFFWLVCFCFFWTLWNNLFANFDNKKLLRSLAAMFGFAFFVKYLLLTYLAAPAEQSLVSSILNNPGQAAITWLFSLPQFSPATGYLQFFTIIIFIVALYFFPNTTEE
ncbi:MAG TPA: hypothetical protein VJ781_07400 [Pyrinomonadaceae bacterium]|nr:hypothetical protein [Pyrinomonadaceae bacterium]